MSCRGWTIAGAREGQPLNEGTGASMSRRSGSVARDAMSAASLVLVVLLAGCQGSEPSVGSIEVAETIAEVDYYYACGNEVLELPDGRRFYPFVDQDQVDEDAYLSAPVPQSASVRLATATLVAVPMPEPGEDIGTLTIFEDGTARFVSETGIEAWLTDEEQTYNWEC